MYPGYTILHVFALFRVMPCTRLNTDYNTVSGAYRQMRNVAVFLPKLSAVVPKDGTKLFGVSAFCFLRDHPVRDQGRQVLRDHPYGVLPSGP
mgnify:CR=1 FL=1